jgi:hypothetical protein
LAGRKGDDRDAQDNESGPGNAAGGAGLAAALPLSAQTTQAPADMSACHQMISALAYSPSGALYALLADGRVVRSKDKGRQWE